MTSTIRTEVAVVGAGQAGLAIGYYLKKHGISHVILDGAPKAGHTWRTRWDSLTLFTPGWFNALPALPFPGPSDCFPTKDDVAAYLAEYADQFALPVRLNTPVKKLHRTERGFVLATPRSTYAVEQVVVATGPFQTPYIPPIVRHATDNGAGDFRIHSTQYRHPGQLPEGPVLVVGAGNSGVQIAVELAKDRKVFLAVGKRMPELPQRILGRDLFWWLSNTGILNVTIDSRLGNRMSRTDPLIGSRLRDLRKRHGIEIVPRATRVEPGLTHLEDGRSLKVHNVIWATGFRPDYSWMNVPVFTQSGLPKHKRGVTDVAGLYFLGLSWQHRRDSALLGGVGRDAEYICRQILKVRNARPSPSLFPGSEE